MWTYDVNGTSYPTLRAAEASLGPGWRQIHSSVNGEYKRYFLYVGPTGSYLSIYVMPPKRAAPCDAPDDTDQDLEDEKHQERRWHVA